MEEPRRIGEWAKICVLGAGSFGVVSLWKNENTDECIAVKKSKPTNCSSLSSKQRQRWVNEVNIMKQIQCETIVGFKPLPAALENELKRYNPSNLPLLSMEYCANGNLKKLLSRCENVNGLQENEVRYILQDMCNAVRYLHNIDITHRDIKPDNIVLQKTDGRPGGVIYKLIDLGYAKELQTLVSFVGTLHYLAPEIFAQQSYKINVDYWSLGIVAFEIITAKLPFLPHLTPVERFNYLAHKSPDVISIYKVGSELMCSSKIWINNHISKCFRRHIEVWLRTVLQFDPLKRGVYEDSTKNVFTELESILSKQIIKVFSVWNFKIYSYEICDGMKMASLKKLVEVDTDIPVGDQYFVTDKILCLYNDDMLVTDCFDEINHQTTLYMFAKGQAIADINIALPDQIKLIFESGQKGITCEILKMAYINSIYFIMQKKTLYAALETAWNLHLRHLDVLFKKEKELFTSVRAACLKLTTEVECYTKVTDIAKMDLKNQKHVQYLINRRKYLRQSKELVENVNSLTERCLKLRRIEAQFLCYAENVKKLLGCADLQQKYDNILKLYQRQSDKLNEQRSDDLSYREMLRTVSNVVKVLRDTVKNDDFIRCMKLSHRLFVKLQNIFKWIDALNAEIHQVSTSLCSNECEKNDLIFGQNSKSTVTSIIFSEHIDENLPETNQLIKDNTSLRYRIQDKMKEGFALIRNISESALDEKITSYNGVN